MGDEYWGSGISGANVMLFYCKVFELAKFAILINVKFELEMQVKFDILPTASTQPDFRSRPQVLLFVRL